MKAEDIHEAANELVEQGINPTLANVRKHLGKGSFTDIAEAMKVWRSKQEDERQLQEIDLPTSINERLNALGGELWQLAVTVADERLSSERQAMESVQAAAIAKSEEAQEAVKILEAESKELMQQMEVLSDSEIKMKKLAEDTAKRADTIYDKYISADHELKLLNSKNEMLVEQRDLLQKNVDDLHDRLTESKEESASLKAIVGELEKDLEQANSKLQNNEEDKKLLAAANNKLSSQLDKCEGKFEVATDQLNKLSDKYSKLLDEKNSLLDDVKKYKSEIDDLEAVNKEFISKEETLLAEIEKLKLENEQLKTEKLGNDD